MRVHFLAEADFVRSMDDDDANRGGGDGTTQPTSCIRGYFHTRPIHVSAAHEPQLLDFFAAAARTTQSINSPAAAAVT